MCVFIERWSAYTSVRGVEGRCRQWGQKGEPYYRKALFTGRSRR